MKRYLEHTHHYPVSVTFIIFIMNVQQMRQVVFIGQSADKNCAFTMLQDTTLELTLYLTVYNRK